MTKKTDNRIAKDKQRLKDAGKNRLTNATKNRQVTSRSWYELKQVHERSARYIARMGDFLRKYLHPQVLMKIADNGREKEFVDLQKSIPALIAPFAAEFEALLKRHEHKRSACTTLADMEEAYQLFEAYQKFDMDYYTVFQPLVTSMNEIFNEALGQLLGGEAIDAKTKSLPTTSEELEAPEGADTGEKRLSFGYGHRVYHFTLDDNYRFITSITAASTAPVKETLPEKNDPILLHDFNTYVVTTTPDMADDTRGGKLTKIGYNEMMATNIMGFPYINKETMELEWFLRNDDVTADEGIDFQESAPV